VAKDVDIIYSQTNWSHQPLAALRWFAAMGSHMDATRLEKFLVHILTPVYRLREDETVRDPQMGKFPLFLVRVLSNVDTHRYR
jgi:hypothetical protein